MKKTLAFISEHASPLATLGSVDSGGQNVYVAEVTKELAACGYNIDVFTRKDDASLPTIYNWLPNVRVIHIEAGPKSFIAKEKLLDYMDEFADRMINFVVKEDINYDLMHAHFFMSALVASKIKAVLKIPYAVTFHALGLVRKKYQKEADKFPAERCSIEKMIVKDADAIIAECPQDKEDLVMLYHADAAKTAIVPCGFSCKEFSPIDKQKARKMLGLNSQDFIMLQLGRMVPRKGVDNVIRALGLLKTKHSSITLLVVGGECDEANISADPEIKRLKQIAANCNADMNIVFTGSKQRKYLKLYYSASDVFISTPWYEPFGITPLEAMACRVPVIGSDVGGIKYSVVDNETGFLVPPKQPLKLAILVDYLIKNREQREQMAENGFQRVHKFFTWKKVTSQLIEVYDKVTEVSEPAASTHTSLPLTLERSISSLLNIKPSFY